jgi:hypothetical protein
LTRTKEFVLSEKLSDILKENFLKASLLNTWLLNLHNADVKAPDPITGEQKPISIACGKLDANGVADLIVSKPQPQQPTSEATAVVA